MKAQIVLCALLAVPSFAPQSPAPRDTPPPAVENARRERELRAAVSAGTATKDTYLELAKLTNLRGQFDDTIEALRGAAKFEPSSPEPQHRIATFYWEYLRSTQTTRDAATRQLYLKNAIAAEDAALALQPDYLDALVYKSMLLRLQANSEPDLMEQKRLTGEADALRQRAMDLQRARHAQGNVASPAGAPAPPPPPFMGFSEPFEQTLARLTPIRVGGNIRTPTKIKDVKPVYPAVAQSARLQGVVILETIIDEHGDIANARVLRSIPLLDEAALGAVSQWQFTPTLLNGQPAGVIMTVTVNFTLQP